MKLFVYSSPLETARALIKHLLGLIDEQPDKIFNIAVSGGNTPAECSNYGPMNMRMLLHGSA